MIAFLLLVPTASMTSMPSLGPDIHHAPHETLLVLQVPIITDDADTMADSPIRIDVARVTGQLEAVNHVAAVTPVLYMSTVERLGFVYGIELDSFNRSRRRLNYAEGGPFEDRRDILLNASYANAEGIRTGQLVHIGEIPLKVRGLVESGECAMNFINLADMQEMLAADGIVNFFYIRVEHEAYIANVMDTIKQLLPKYTLRTIDEYGSWFKSEFAPGAKMCQDAIAALAYE